MIEIYIVQFIIIMVAVYLFGYISAIFWRLLKNGVTIAIRRG